MPKFKKTKSNFSETLSYHKRVDLVRQKHPMAYESWTSKADKELKLLYNEGKTTAELSEKFKRRPGAIRSHLKKLGLIESSNRDSKSKKKPIKISTNNKIITKYTKKEELIKIWERVTKRYEIFGYKPTEATEAQRDYINELVRWLDRRDAATLISLLQMLNNRKKI